jgi:hypothetical protein
MTDIVERSTLSHLLNSQYIINFRLAKQISACMYAALGHLPIQKSRSVRVRSLESSGDSGDSGGGGGGGGSAQSSFPSDDSFFWASRPKQVF